MGSAPAFSTPFFKSTPRQYMVALAAMLVAFLIAESMTQLAGGNAVYLVLPAAVAFSVSFCGPGASALAIAVAVIVMRYWFIQPSHSFSIPHGPQALSMLLFVLVSLVIAAIGDRRRRELEALHNSNQELQEQLRERTAELGTANKGLGDLTARLLQFQDEERRRIARELHDSAGQSLAALAMNLSSLGTDIERLAKSATVVSDSVALVNEMSRDIRTISYLLHPPLLDDAGLASALRWYIRGFTQRSGIAVDFELAEDFERLPRDLETAIFRLIQECLTNIHRHSESPVATISIDRSGGEVRVEVEDRGKGIGPEKKLTLLSAGTPGVGIRGLRERIRQLGGTLEIRSDGEGRGTAISVRLPVANARSNVAVAAAGSSAE